MSAADAATRGRPVSASRLPGLVPASRTARLAMRGAVIWGTVFGLFWWLLVNDYSTNYPTASDRARLVAETNANIGMQAMFGPVHHLDIVAGYAAWHGVGVLAVIGGIWGLLTGTRLMRGEEEAGRWEVLLAGQTTRRRAALGGFAGLGIGLIVVWAINVVAAYVFGQSADPPFTATGSVFLATAVAAPAAIFLAVGALCSQLAATRGRAAWLAAAVFAVAYTIRLTAYTDPSASWLRWLSPLAWVDEIRPLTDNRAGPLLLIAALILVLVTSTTILAGRRDLGAAVLPARDTAPARTRLLTGTLGLTVRLARPGTLGWTVSIGVAGLVFGFLAKTSAEVFANASGGVLEALGGANGSEVYLGITFLVVALVVTLAACGQVSATREEEAEGRLDNLLVRPAARWPWLAGRFAIAAIGLTLAGLAAGLFTWVGAVLGGADLAFATLLAAGLNVVPAGIVVLGVGTLAHGVVPRFASGVAYGLVAWSFVVELVGAGLPGARRLQQLSVLHHITRAPAEDPRWGMAAFIVVIGVAAAVVGITAFNRRDLRGS